MTRLQSELQRLFLPPGSAPDAVPDLSGLPDADAPVRLLLLELARPADWTLLSRLWQGVQVDLGLPAPAIAVSGSDGFQLWFSLAQAVPRSQALDFLAALRRRYWPEVAERRLRQWPVPAQQGVAAAEPAWPGRQVQPDQWSAFVSPDLAPVFAETPWLDIEPVEEGQAQLLRGLSPIAPAAWAAALSELTAAAAQHSPAAAIPVAPAPAPAAVVAVTAAAAGADADADAPGRRTEGPPLRHRDPREFLLEVMNDPSVEMALRIEAAKALLA